MTKKAGLRFRMWWTRKKEAIDKSLHDNPLTLLIIFWGIIAAITFCSLLWMGAAIGNILKHDREMHNV